MNLTVEKIKQVYKYLERQENNMIIKAKVNVGVVHKTTYSENVEMAPVYSSDKEDPNFSYSQATPSGKIELCITNEGAHGFFKPGKKYLVTFEETE